MSGVNETVRPLPFSAEAEASTLGAILIVPNLFTEAAALLVTDDFLLPAHRDIWEAYVTLDHQEKPLDVLLVADELAARGVLSRLEDGMGYLTKIASEAPVTGNIAHYAGIVAEKALARKLIAACAETMSRAYGGETDARELLDEHAGTVMGIAQRGVSDLVTIADAAEECLATFERRQTSGNPITGVKTGIGKLDRYTGGLQPENVVVVAARPGVGKTAFGAGVVLTHVLRDGGAGLIFSLEMSKAELVERMFARQAGVDSNNLKHGEISQYDWLQLTKAGSDFASANLCIVDDQFTMSQIEATARRFRTRHPNVLCVIMIDYVQLIETPLERGQKRSDALGDVSRRVKRLAKRLKVPIIEIAQLNRDSDKERRAPKMSDLRESGAIEQDADIILFPDDYQMRQKAGVGEEAPHKTIDGAIDLLMPKNRNGLTGSIQAHWRAKHYSFTDIAPEWQQQQEERYP